jgi:hypothetical protein
LIVIVLILLIIIDCIKIVFICLIVIVYVVIIFIAPVVIVVVFFFLIFILTQVINQEVSVVAIGEECHHIWNNDADHTDRVSTALHLHLVGEGDIAGTEFIGYIDFQMTSSNNAGKSSKLS